MTDDFVLVNSTATVENKRQLLADFNLPGFKIDPYVLEQKVEKAWGDAATVGTLLHLSWTQHSEHHSRVLRIANVWKKRDGHRRATYAQVICVP